MSSMTEARVAKYGSAAELASYAGLSVKTIRRLVDAGKVRGQKVGRRLLIPFEDLDAHILRIDDHRRPIVTEDSTDALEVGLSGRDHRAEAIQALDELDDLGDDDEQQTTFAALVESLDEWPTSARRRFG